MEARLDAFGDLAALARESAERLNVDLPDVRGSVSGLESRMESVLAELRRLGDEVAHERARRDVETDLLEVINQQRAARVRMEEQVALFGEQLEEARQRLGAAAEERAALARQAARADQRLLALAEALEAQRDTIIEHFERLLDAERAAALKQVEGIEGGLRAGRELLTKLREESDPASAEPPL